MIEREFAEIKDFRDVVLMLNKELNAKGIYEIDYLLINNSVDDVIRVLIDNSMYYNLIKDDRYSNGACFKELMELYFQKVKEYYASKLIQDGNNNRTADKYYNKSKEPIKNNGQYFHVSKNNIGMIQQDVNKTLILMKEAIQAYYKVYHNKKLVAELTTNRIDKNDYLEFVIKEEQLLHLLGVSADQLRNNPDFIRLTGNKNMNSVEILEWIIRDLDGNNNLIQYSEDFLKRISKGNFELLENQFDNNTQTRILNYHKVGVKSQTFLKYGPFESVSLVVKLKNGKKLTLNSKSNTAMISRAECFKKYPWAYFGSVQNPNQKYIETLLIDTAEGKKQLFKNSTPAIVKGVYGIDDGGIGAKSTHIFSEQEQFNLFCLAYQAFQETMNFKDLKEYFTQLFNQKNYENNNIKQGNLLSKELTSKIFNLDITSLEMLYDDIIELVPRSDAYIYNNKSKNEYLHKIFENIKYLSPDQIYEIDSMIYENQYIRNNKKRK